MSGVQRITISAADADQRLDRWLKRYSHSAKFASKRCAAKASCELMAHAANPQRELRRGKRCAFHPSPPPNIGKNGPSNPTFRTKIVR